MTVQERKETRHGSTELKTDSLVLGNRTARAGHLVFGFSLEGRFSPTQFLLPTFLRDEKNHDDRKYYVQGLTVHRQQQPPAHIQQLITRTRMRQTTKKVRV
jgi:hypothetical protein